ncbi:MAG: NYN domain-containing protein [Zavarzinella sp.]
MESTQDSTTNGSYTSFDSVKELNMAIFVDFESINANRLRAWLNQFRLEGRVCICRAYADWTTHPHETVQKLMKMSIDLVQVNNYVDRGKNGVDIRLAVDAMEIVFSNRRIDKFIFVASDSDYIALVVKLKEYNKVVHMVGNKKSTSQSLIGYCDQFDYLSDIEKEPQRGTDNRVENIQDKSEAFELMDEALQLLSLNKPGQEYRDSSINDTMIRLNPSFDYRRIGYKTLRDFLTDAEAMERIVYVEGDDKKGYVRLYNDKSKVPASAPSRPEAPPAQINPQYTREVLMLFKSITENPPRDAVAYSELIQYGGMYLKDAPPQQLRNTIKAMIANRMLLEFYHPDKESHLLIRLSDEAAARIRAFTIADYPQWYWTLRYAKMMATSRIPTNMGHTVNCWKHCREMQQNPAATGRSLQDFLNYVVSLGYIREDRIREHFDIMIRSGILVLDDQHQVSIPLENEQDVWKQLASWMLETLAKDQDVQRDPKALREVVLNIRDLSDGSREMIDKVFAELEKQ